MQPDAELSNPMSLVFTLDAECSVSSPLIESIRSTTSGESLPPPERASLMMAKLLPTSCSRSKSFAASELSVGPQTFCLPISAVSMRPITPRPPRVGPTMMKIFCRSSRLLMT